jgi:type IV pilus assembly protein PilV
LELFKKSNGFTLIEILVALVILSVSLLALAGLMATTTMNNSGGGHLTEAATFAQDTLERLRVSPLSSMPLDVTTTDNPVGATGTTYTRSWRAVADVPAPNNNVNTITVTVSWSDPAKRQPYSITMISTVPL